MRGNLPTHGPVKLIVGLISNEADLFKEVELSLSKKFGPVDYKSDLFKFNHTGYYKRELGENLLRVFLSFHKLINPGTSYKIKLFTNRLEAVFQRPSRARRINIDPGYISLGKLILFTTKNYSHRIYLKNGIYAEVTLHYKNGAFMPWEWTYPDYKTRLYLEFFNKVRDIYQGRLSSKYVNKKKK